MSQHPRRDIGRIIREGTAIDRAMVAAQRRTILRHRQLGIPLVLWRDGQVVEVDAATVELPELPDEAPDSGD